MVPVQVSPALVCTMLAFGNFKPGTLKTIKIVPPKKQKKKIPQYLSNIFIFFYQKYYAYQSACITFTFFSVLQALELINPELVSRQVRILRKRGVIIG